jgi:predicted secreted protein
MQTFIPGYLTEITLDGTDVTLIGQVTSYSDDQTAVPKPTFGTKYRRTIAGQSLYSIDVSGHLAAESAGDLWALKASSDAVAWSIQIGEAGAATDGGILAGNAVVTNLTMDSDAESNWSWSCTLEGDGDPTYTPATPAP